MKTYVINLERAPERWAHMQKVFAKTSFELERVNAVEGKLLELPISEFDEERFRKMHGRGINIFEIACYLSHIKAMRLFLETSETHALICEDDLHPKLELSLVVDTLMKTAGVWNIARLAGLKLGRPVKITPLTKGYSLAVPLQRFKGTGAYLLDRRAAEAFVKGLLPMWLPFDHALDREWCHGVTMVSVTPFPVSQVEEVFTSGIQGNAQPRLHSSLRRRFTYPYQIKNELSRWLYRVMRVMLLKLLMPTIHHSRVSCI